MEIKTLRFIACFMLSTIHYFLYVAELENTTLLYKGLKMVSTQSDRINMMLHKKKPKTFYDIQLTILFLPHAFTHIHTHVHVNRNKHIHTT